LKETIELSQDTR